MAEVYEAGRNLLITGATGAGKSYISNALCIAAIRQFKTNFPFGADSLSAIADWLFRLSGIRISGRH